MHVCVIFLVIIQILLNVFKFMTVILLLYKAQFESRQSIAIGLSVCPSVCLSVHQRIKCKIIIPVWIDQLCSTSLVKLVTPGNV